MANFIGVLNSHVESFAVLFVVFAFFCMLFPFGLFYANLPICHNGCVGRHGGLCKFFLMTDK